MEQISIQQSHLIPVKEIPKHKVWFEYLFNKEEPVKSTFWCRLCYKYYDQFNLPQNHRNSFADEKGTLKKYKFENKKFLAEHGNIPGHKAVVQLLQERSEKRLKKLHFFEIFSNCL